MASIAHLDISSLLARHPVLRTSCPNSISNITSRIANIVFYLFEYFIHFFIFVNINFKLFLGLMFLSLSLRATTALQIHLAQSEKSLELVQQLPSRFVDPQNKPEHQFFWCSGIRDNDSSNVTTTTDECSRPSLVNTSPSEQFSLLPLAPLPFVPGYRSGIDQ
jgi:hypothetical protein